ncbi:hypothetical protein EDB89DRAFT_1906502 [Lactarius sanguifluus]|nr:hypothetical protein EDB89DRAFT_1906502 [Lactarius sanguifluus]
MSSKTPLPRITGMALRAREKDSHKHPGKPDLPRQKQSSSVVQAEKVEKARAQTEKEEMPGENIQATANVEVQMKEKMKEKLVNAHHPQPSTQKKVPRPRNKVQQVSKGATSDIPECLDLDGVAQDEVPRDSGEEYVPDGKDTVESEDEESDVLDESDPGKEPTKQHAKKKKPDQGSLRAAVQAAQGKSVQDGDLKCKAASNADTEELFRSQKKYKKANTGLYDDWSKRAQHESPGEDDAQVVRLHPCSTQTTTREESLTTLVRRLSAWAW